MQLNRNVYLDKSALDIRMLKTFKLLIALTLFLLTAELQAQSFQEGKNAERDGNYKAAFEIWLSLSRNGDVSAQTSLAFLYKNGQGVERDLNKAITWFKEAPEGAIPQPRI